MTRYCPRCDLRARESESAHPTGSETEWANGSCTGCGLTLASPLTAEEMDLVLERDARLTRPGKARYSLC